MFYSYEITEIPKINKYYTVTRNTVWQIAENEHILIFIKDGECEITLNGELFSLKKGDIFYMPAYNQYTRRPIEDKMCTMTYIHFSTTSPINQENFKELINLLKDKKKVLDTEILSGEPQLSYFNTVYICNNNQMKDYTKIFGLLKNINLFSSKRPLICNLQSSITLCNILILLSQNTLDLLLSDANIKSGTAVPLKLHKAIGYIMKHYTEPISLDDLSEFCSISKQQLIRYFKSAFNTTPVNYITEYKLSRAKDMLFNHPNLSIKEIAAELGFYNQHYFTRVFTKKNGETPTNYRNRTVFYKKKK